MIVLCMLVGSSLGQKAQTTEKKFYKACEEYIATYNPLYVVNGDTLLVARFNLVPEELNQYLIRCAKRKEFHLLKFSAALMIRQNIEYNLKNHSDYLVGEATVQKNGFIVLMLEAMGYQAAESDEGYPSDLIAYTGDFCTWILKNKEMIRDYQFVENYRREMIERYQVR